MNKTAKAIIMIAAIPWLVVPSIGQAAPDIHADPNPQITAILAQDAPAERSSEAAQALTATDQQTPANAASEAVVATPPGDGEDYTALPSEPPSLSDLVETVDVPNELDAQVLCLATTVYFEARGEPLEGQLAVAEVVINRSRSGRYPSTFCGVATQRAQFSFVRRGIMPRAPRNAAWRRALAIAHIAISEMWQTDAAEALYFHADYVRPGWRHRLRRLVELGNHIFYR